MVQTEQKESLIKKSSRRRMIKVKRYLWHEFRRQGAGKILFKQTSGSPRPVGEKHPQAALSVRHLQTNNWRFDQLGDVIINKLRLLPAELQNAVRGGDDRAEQDRHRPLRGHPLKFGIRGAGLLLADFNECQLQIRAEHWANGEDESGRTQECVWSQIHQWVWLDLVDWQHRCYLRQFRSVSHPRG